MLAQRWPEDSLKVHPAAGSRHPRGAPAEPGDRRAEVIDRRPARRSRATHYDEYQASDRQRRPRVAPTAVLACDLPDAALRHRRFDRRAVPLAELARLVEHNRIRAPTHMPAGSSAADDSARISNRADASMRRRGARPAARTPMTDAGIAHAIGHARRQRRDPRCARRVACSGARERSGRGCTAQPRGASDRDAAQLRELTIVTGDMELEAPERPGLPSALVATTIAIR